MKNYLKQVQEKYGLSKLIGFPILFSTIIFEIDKLNIASSFFKDYYMIPIALLIIALFIVYDIKLYKALKYRYINSVDYFLIFFFVFSLIYIILNSIPYLLISMCWKYIVNSIFIFLIVIIVSIRIKILKAGENISAKYKPTLVDLKDLCENPNKIKIDENAQFLIEENDVDYDLLDRGNTINQLYDGIKNVRSEKSYVISLEGKWGSGKSTIINSVKRKLKDEEKKLKIIDEFDPWAYVDPESMLANMIDAILENSNYTTVFNIKKIINNTRIDVFGVRAGLTYSLLKKAFTKTEDLSKIRGKINKILETNEARIVFFIDNIDRTTNRNIQILFSLIGSVLNFNRVTYVLSYDSERINDIFDKSDVDCQYLKKIVNYRIKIPAIDRDIVNKRFSE